MLYAARSQSPWGSRKLMHRNEKKVTKKRKREESLQDNNCLNSVVEMDNRPKLEVCMKGKN
jgi:hypothetical protein